MEKPYFVRNIKTEINKKTGEEVIYYEVPLPVNIETAAANNADIKMVKIGWKLYPCIYVYIPVGKGGFAQDKAEGFTYSDYQKFMMDFAKNEERKARCRISDGKGGLIMCPETNRCQNCKKRLKDNFWDGHPLSLEGIETNDDGATEERFKSGFGSSALENIDELVLISELGNDIAKRLDAIKPKYGLIFRELLNGVTRPCDISTDTGLPENRIGEALPRIRKLTEQILKDIID